MERSHRTTEGKLLIFASLVLLMGFALTFMAKLPELRTEGTANVNTAPPEEVAGALGIDPGLAKLICERRERHGAFTNTSSVESVKLLTNVQAEALADIHRRRDITSMSAMELSSEAGLPGSVAERLAEALAATGDAQASVARLARIPALDGDAACRADVRLRARDPGPTAASYWIHAAFLLAGFFVFHAFLRRKTPAADPYILPCADAGGPGGDDALLH